jgi:SAM-dependent methyltransferase
MPFGFIDPAEYSINCLTLMDRWIVRRIADNRSEAFRAALADVLANHPVLLWYVESKCPERREYFERQAENGRRDLRQLDLREVEMSLLASLDWAVVYVYPEAMERVGYMDWDPQKLLSLTDFTNKYVLDVGSGTGRLAFAAAAVASHVWVTEPVDRLREYLREKKERLNVTNMSVVDATVTSIPFPDSMFDISMSGYVVGEDIEAELRELGRVTKPGGMVIDCPGEDDRKQPDGPNPDLVERGFCWSHYVSKYGGDVYRYWKQL